MHQDYLMAVNSQLIKEGTNIVLNSSDVFKMRDSLKDDFATLRVKFHDELDPDDAS